MSDDCTCGTRVYGDPPCPDSLPPLPSLESVDYMIAQVGNPIDEKGKKLRDDLLEYRLALSARLEVTNAAPATGVQSAAEGPGEVR